VQNFTATGPAEKLKNWKSEKLTSRPATRLTRISDFQDFRFSPLHLLPGNLAGGFRDGVGIGTSGTY
jgi:hypothetical protein